MNQLSNKTTWPVNRSRKIKSNVLRLEIYDPVMPLKTSLSVSINIILCQWKRVPFFVNSLVALIFAQKREYPCLKTFKTQTKWPVNFWIQFTPQTSINRQWYSFCPLPAQSSRESRKKNPFQEMIFLCKYQVLITSGALELNSSNAPPHQVCQGASDDVPHRHERDEVEGHYCYCCWYGMLRAMTDDATPLDDNATGDGDDDDDDNDDEHIWVLTRFVRMAFSKKKKTH